MHACLTNNILIPKLTWYATVCWVLRKEAKEQVSNTVKGAAAKKGGHGEVRKETRWVIEREWRPLGVVNSVFYVRDSYFPDKHKRQKGKYV